MRQYKLKAENAKVVYFLTQKNWLFPVFLTL